MYHGATLGSIRHVKALNVCDSCILLIDGGGLQCSGQMIVCRGTNSGRGGKGSRAVRLPKRSRQKGVGRRTRRKQEGRRGQERRGGEGTRDAPPRSARLALWGGKRASGAACTILFLGAPVQPTRNDKRGTKDRNGTQVSFDNQLVPTHPRVPFILLLLASVALSLFSTLPRHTSIHTRLRADPSEPLLPGSACIYLGLFS